MVSTNTSSNQWLSLAKPTDKWPLLVGTVHWWAISEKVFIVLEGIPKELLLSGLDYKIIFLRGLG